PAGARPCEIAPGWSVATPDRFPVLPSRRSCGRVRGPRRQRHRRHRFAPDLKVRPTAHDDVSLIGRMSALLVTPAGSAYGPTNIAACEQLPSLGIGEQTQRQWTGAHAVQRLPLRPGLIV